ncbi:hypothetical protein HVPorG_04228 [Roseomonas mucosa]|nr:hypothetical protein HVPorG_04228 [Roseomonas mucosa]
MPLHRRRGCARAPSHGEGGADLDPGVCRRDLVPATGVDPKRDINIQGC